VYLMKPKSTEHQGLPDQGGLPGHDRLGSTLDAVVSQRMAGPAGPGPEPQKLDYVRSLPSGNLT